MIGQKTGWGRNSSRCQDCSQKVTGPSLIRLTCMSAPKRPLATTGCWARAAVSSDSNSGWATAGVAAVATYDARVYGLRDGLFAQVRRWAAVTMRPRARGRSLGATCLLPLRGPSEEDGRGGR